MAQNDEQTKLLREIRALLRQDPAISASDLKRSLSVKDKPLAFYSILLSKAKQAEEEVAEQLDRETSVAEETAAAESEDDAGEPDPELYLKMPDGQVKRIEWESSNDAGTRQYFRFVG